MRLCILNNLRKQRVWFCILFNFLWTSPSFGVQKVQNRIPRKNCETSSTTLDPELLWQSCNWAKLDPVPRPDATIRRGFFQKSIAVRPRLAADWTDASDERLVLQRIIIWPARYIVRFQTTLVTLWWTKTKPGHQDSNSLKASKCARHKMWSYLSKLKPAFWWTKFLCAVYALVDLALWNALIKCPKSIEIQCIWSHFLRSMITCPGQVSNLRLQLPHGSDIYKRIPKHRVVLWVYLFILRCKTRKELLLTTYCSFS